MLYLKEYISEATLIGIWRIEESKEELISQLTHIEWIKDIYSYKSETRVLEVLATRILIKKLLGEEKRIVYNNNGKPSFTDDSYYISISHTQEYIAVALNKERPIGVDIELISEKIKRVQSRIISDKEYIDKENELIHLLLHWSAKEAIFKFIDSEGVDFRKHLIVEKFKPQNEGIFYASEYRTDINHHFKAYYRVEKDFVLVCIEPND